MPSSTVPGREREQLRAFGYLLARSGRIIESEISGTSMERTLPSGSKIRIQPLPAEEYRVGRIIAFVLSGTVFAHRIICRTRQGVLTRGDNRSLCDAPVPLDAVLGAVTEWFVDGEWQHFEGRPRFLFEQSKSIRTAEMLACACMRIDIRLAAHVSRGLMRLARLRPSFGL